MSFELDNTLNSIFQTIYQLPIFIKIEKNVKVYCHADNADFQTRIVISVACIRVICVPFLKEKF
jgi:hypothetical protein